MGNTNRGVGGVDVLTACARGAEGVNLQIAGIDLRQFRFRDLRHYGDRTGRGVDTTLRFRFRHALHAVSARFKFHAAIGTLSGHPGNHLFVSAVLTVVGADDLHTPAAGFSIAAVHAEQIAREDRRFITAGTGAHFNETGAFIIGIFWQQQHLQLLLQGFALLARCL